MKNPTATTVQSRDGQIVVLVTAHSNSSSPRARRWYGVSYGVWFRNKMHTLSADLGDDTLPRIHTKADAVKRAKLIATQDELQHEDGVWMPPTQIGYPVGVVVRA